MYEIKTYANDPNKFYISLNNRTITVFSKNKAFCYVNPTFNLLCSIHNFKIDIKELTDNLNNYLKSLGIKYVILDINVMDIEDYEHLKLILNNFITKYDLIVKEPYVSTNASLMCTYVLKLKDEVTVKCADNTNCKLLINQCHTTNCQYTSFDNFEEIMLTLLRKFDSDKNSFIVDFYEALKVAKSDKNGFDCFIKKETFNSFPESIKQFLTHVCIYILEIEDYYQLKICYRTFGPNSNDDDDYLEDYSDNECKMDQYGFKNEFNHMTFTGISKSLIESYLL